MREIKFRAYVKLEGKPKEEMVYFDFDRISDDGYGDNSDIVCCDKIMQFTGLKDKNGKECYEGHIIRFLELDQSVEDLTSHDFGEIVWNDSQAWFEIAEHDQPLGAYLPEDIEIIGNKYENPELLK